MTKVFSTFVIGILLFLSSSNTRASHYPSGSLTYTYIGDSTGISGEYQFEIVVYVYNFDGNPLVGGYGVRQLGCNIDEIFLLSKIIPPSHRAHPSDSSLWIMSNTINCSDSNNHAMYVFRGTKVISGTCANYTFTSTTPCCREVLDNFSATIAVTLKATLNNLHGPNSLPKPKHHLFLASGCVGKTLQFGGYKLDNDQDLGAILPTGFTNGTTTLGWSSPHTIYSPLPTNPPGPGGFSVDTLSGLTTLNPSARGNYGLAYLYTERRFDTTASVYYTVGSYVLEIILPVGNFCNSAMSQGPDLSFENTLQTQSDTCGLPYSFLKTNQPILKATVDTNGTDFSVFSFRRQAPEPVKSAEVVGPNLIKLNYFFPLSANDTLRIISKIGADGNRIVNACGFDQSQVDTLYQIVNGCNVGLPDEKRIQFAVYPNPSYGIFKITNSSTHTIEQIRVFSLQGAALYASSSSNRQLDISHLRAGTYILNLTLSNGESRQKKITLL